jgi:hypothetical protein
MTKRYRRSKLELLALELEERVGYGAELVSRAQGYVRRFARPAWREGPLNEWRRGAEQQLVKEITEELKHVSRRP